MILFRDGLFRCHTIREHNFERHARFVIQKVDRQAEYGYGNMTLSWTVCEECIPRHGITGPVTILPILSPGDANDEEMILVEILCHTISSLSRCSA